MTHFHFYNHKSPSIVFSFLHTASTSTKTTDAIIIVWRFQWEFAKNWQTWIDHEGRKMAILFPDGIFSWEYHIFLHLIFHLFHLLICSKGCHYKVWHQAWSERNFGGEIGNNASEALKIPHFASKCPISPPKSWILPI